MCVCVCVCAIAPVVTSPLECERGPLTCDRHPFTSLLTPITSLIHTYPPTHTHTHTHTHITYHRPGSDFVDLVLLDSEAPTTATRPSATAANARPRAASENDDDVHGDTHGDVKRDGHLATRYHLWLENMGGAASAATVRHGLTVATVSQIAGVVRKLLERTKRAAGGATRRFPVY